MPVNSKNCTKEMCGHLEHIRFLVRYIWNAQKDEIIVPADFKIRDLLQSVQSATDRSDIEVYWKLGSHFDEYEECLNELQGDLPLIQFINDNKSELIANIHPTDSALPSFYLTVDLKSPEEDPNSEYNRQMREDVAWFFNSLGGSINNPNAASISTSLEANTDESHSSTSLAPTPLAHDYCIPRPQVPDSENMANYHYPEPLADDAAARAAGAKLPLMLESGPSQAAWVSPLKRDSDDAYVGLVNQAMTCYLNSLLQTLFMTPEFRNALYNWEYTGTKDEQNKSIPYQLQKLFVLLQTTVGSKTALETKDLTKSFGWDSSHAWDQHDVQELCRVMFDALELKWRRTNQATVITALYQGTMQDYVKCLECSTENAKNDVFLDLPLAIKPFGSNQAYKSVEEAFRGFVQPEVLEGSNQYYCDKCQKKVNAHKGLKITKFPYLLTIQLKRFDFDYTTMHRIKLNDRMSFPDLLNLNPFVEVQEAAVAAPDEPAMDGQSDQDKTLCEPAVVDSMDGASADEAQSQASNLEQLEEIPPPLLAADSDDEGICVDGTVGGGTSSASSPIDVDDENEGSSHHDPSLVNAASDRCLLQQYLKEGPFVYELFSIMVHSGSANGGHYYAYIKNLDTKIWYCFNDQVVTRASIEDIRKTYGGASSSPFMYSSYGSSTNGYMLMYRQIDPERNVKLPSNHKLPEHILRMIDKLHLEEEEQRQVEERQRSMITVRVHYYDPSDGNLLEKEFVVQKRDLVSSVVALAHEAFNLATLHQIPVELCRLVKFAKHKEMLEASMDNNKLIQQELPLTYATPELLLETARHPGWFIPYSNNGITLKVFFVDLEVGRVRQPKRLLYAMKETMIKDLKERIGELFQCDAARMQLVLDHYTHHLRLLDVPHKTLHDEDVWNQGTIFVECGRRDEDAIDQEPAVLTTPEDFENTRFYAVLDQFKNTIRLKVALPSISEYNAVGFTAPFKVNPVTPVIREIDDVYMRSVEDPPCPSTANATIGSVPPTPTAAAGPRMSLHIQQPEDCSTASGSTQYVTPATSRSPSPEHYASTMSPMSCDGPGAEVADLDVNMSGYETPSPQVSPDASPNSATYAKPNFEMSAAEIEKNFPLLENIISSTTPPMHYVPNVEYGYDNHLSKIDVDSNGENEGVKATDDETATSSSQKTDYFFEVVTSYSAMTATTAPVLAIDADKRTLLSDFVQKLAPLVGVNPDQFKLYKLFTGSEYECTYSATSTLDNITTANGLRIKLGRPLKDGEALVKFLRFELNDHEAYGKHLFDMALMTCSKIEDIKQECQLLLKRQCGLDVPAERIRLRESGNGYMDILHDGSALRERTSYWSCDLYLQILEEPEMAKTDSISIFLRRWCPSTLSLGPVQETVFSGVDSIHIRQGNFCDFFTRISRLSKIPLEKLQCAFTTNAEGSFPYECGKLKLLDEVSFYSVPADMLKQSNGTTTAGLSDEQKLASSASSTVCDMNSEGDGGKRDTDDTGGNEPSCSNVPNYHTPGFFRMRRDFESFGQIFQPTHDGMLVYYRDSQELPKVLSDDERKELQIKDNSRLRKNQTSYSWRKERALKIYTEISSSMTDELD